MNRITADALFMSIAHLMAERGTCIRAKVGAVIVSDRRIVSTGYVGAPPGEPHCTDSGCEVGPSGGCLRTIHAEANALAYAARNGVRVEGSTLYTTHAPCRPCAQSVLSSGIKRVVFSSNYREEALEVLSHVSVMKLESKPFQHPFLGHYGTDCLLCGENIMAHT